MNRSSPSVGLPTGGWAFIESQEAGGQAWRVQRDSILIATLFNCSNSAYVTRRVISLAVGSPKVIAAIAHWPPPYHGLNTHNTRRDVITSPYHIEFVSSPHWLITRNICHHCRQVILSAMVGHIGRRRLLAALRQNAISGTSQLATSASPAPGWPLNAASLVISRPLVTAIAGHCRCCRVNAIGIG